MIIFRNLSILSTPTIITKFRIQACGNFGKKVQLYYVIKTSNGIARTERWFWKTFIQTFFFEEKSVNLILFQKKSTIWSKVKTFKFCNVCAQVILCSSFAKHLRTNNQLPWTGDIVKCENCKLVDIPVHDFRNHLHTGEHVAGVAKTTTRPKIGLKSCNKDFSEKNLWQPVKI